MVARSFLDQGHLMRPHMVPDKKLTQNVWKQAGLIHCKPSPPQKDKYRKKVMTILLQIHKRCLPL